MSDPIREKMQAIGQDVKKHIPDSHGFFVLVFPFENPDGRANYVSNGRREDVIRVMKEWLIQCGHKEDWMKHLN